MPAEEMAAEEEAPTPWYDTGVVWYGKLNGGIHLGGSADGQFKNNGSRWGVKGAHELSEGLSAVYNFEASIDTANATTLDNNRLSYMGLSGGFGNLTMGRIWSASENNAGGWRFLNPWHGSSDTTGRISNAVSYAFSSGMASFQVDAVMGPQDTGNTVDELGFGATINLGDIGRLGFAHRKVEDTLMAGMATPDAMPTAPTTPVTPTTPTAPTGGNMYKSNSDPIVFGQISADSKIHEPGTLEVWQYVHTPADGTAKTVVELYRVPTGNAYYDSTNTASEVTDGDVGSAEDTVATYFDDDKNEGYKVSTAPSDASKVIGDKVVAAKDITVVTLTKVGGDKPETMTYYRVSKGNKYYRTTDTAAGETSNKHMEYTADNAPAAFDASTVMLTRVKADGMTDGGDAGGGDAGGGDAGGGDAGGGDAGGMTTETEVDTPGHTENHVTLQLNLGAMTGTLGYSEIDNNAKEMDKKITFVGLNGAIGDTGMSWTAFSRNVDEHDGSDTNSWGASLSKSLGTGTSVYIDYGDDGDDGTTFAGLSVSF